MVFLALDTSTTSGSISLIKEDLNNKNGKIVYQHYLDVNTTHSERLLPEVDKALKINNLSKSDLSAVLVSVGPGSFTGVRIGLATAKGICTGLNIPLIPFNTLDLLAANVFGTEVKILSVIDARMGEAYAAIYNPDLSVHTDAFLLKHNTENENLNHNLLCVGDIHLLPANDKLRKALPHQNTIQAISMYSLLKLRDIKPDYCQDVIDKIEPNYIRSARAQINN